MEKCICKVRTYISNKTHMKVDSAYSDMWTPRMLYNFTSLTKIGGLMYFSTC